MTKQMAALGLCFAMAATACDAFQPSSGALQVPLVRDKSTGALRVAKGEGATGYQDEAAPFSGAGGTDDRGDMRWPEDALEPGDQIKMIDGRLVDALSRETIVGMLKGPVGSRVRLTVIRGGEVLHISMARTPVAQ